MGEALITRRGGNDTASVIYSGSYGTSYNPSKLYLSDIWKLTNKNTIYVNWTGMNNGYLALEDSSSVIAALYFSASSSVYTSYSTYPLFAPKKVGYMSSVSTVAFILKKDGNYTKVIDPDTMSVLHTCYNGSVFFSYYVALITMFA